MINDNSLVINDELHINLSDRSIMNIENKTLIKLRPKPFRVLLYLHNHNGRCVSKDELLIPSVAQNRSDTIIFAS